jgi:transcription antitermination factor NusG
MPFGLTNAPATFQAMMQRVLYDYLDKFVVVYLDDILIYSKDYESHLKQLKMVLDKLRSYKLYAKKDKCEFVKRKVNFLGFIVSEKGLEVDSVKIDRIKEWPLPLKTVRDLRAFLGLTAYYRKFIKNYAGIAKPLYALLEKVSPMLWTEDAQVAAETLKERLVAAPILALPDTSQPFIVTTNASTYAVGAVLSQKIDGVERPVAFEGRKLRVAEVNYPVHERELLAVIYALHKWQIYLMHKRFTILTDHLPLKYYLSQPKLSARQIRWMQFLANFEFDIQYKEGRRNVVADAISRRPDYRDEPELKTHKIKLNNMKELHAYVVSTIDATELIKKFDEAIEQDEEYKQFEIDSNSDEYEKHNNRIYKRLSANKLVLLIPNYLPLKNFIIDAYHATKWTGHMGRDKTIANIQHEYYWKNMNKEIAERVKACDVCQKTKEETSKLRGLLYPHQIPNNCWEVVTMDFIMPLPRTDKGYDGIFVVVDKFSKYAIFCECKSTISAKQTAELFIKHVFIHFGMPKQIISDRDARFLSSFWTHLFRLLDVKLMKSSAYHPQTDGQTERMNKTLIQMLRSCIQQYKEQWDVLLPMMQFAYNNSMQDSTGYKPFFLVYGRIPHIPYILHTIVKRKIDSRNDYVKKFVEEIKEVITHAADKMKHAQKKQKLQADKKRRNIEYEVGDLVLIRSYNFRGAYDKRKFDVKYFGPFPVSAKLSRVTYRVNLLHLMNCHDVFHISQLKKYTGACKVITTPLGDVDRYEEDEGLEEEDIIYDSEEPLQVKEVSIDSLSEVDKQYYSPVSTDVEVVASPYESDDGTTNEIIEENEEDTLEESNDSTQVSRRSARFQIKKHNLDDVQKIIRCRQNKILKGNRYYKGELEYLVKYKNKPYTENEWIPFEEIVMYPHLLEEFEKTPQPSQELAFEDDRFIFGGEECNGSDQE